MLRCRAADTTNLLLTTQKSLNTQLPTILSCREAWECSWYANDPYSIHSLRTLSSTSTARLKQRSAAMDFLCTGASIFSSIWQTGGKTGNILCTRKSWGNTLFNFVGCCVGECGDELLLIADTVCVWRCVWPCAHVCVQTRTYRHVCMLGWKLVHFWWV